MGLMEDELGGRVITEFVALRTKTYSYLTLQITRVIDHYLQESIKSNWINGR